MLSYTSVVSSHRTADADIQEELARMIRMIEDCDIRSLAVISVVHAKIQGDLQDLPRSSAVLQVQQLKFSYMNHVIVYVNYVNSILCNCC